MQDTLRINATGARTKGAEIRVPSDKSITIRAVLLGAAANGTTFINNPLDALDTRSALDAVQALGAKVEKTDEAWIVHGDKLQCPDAPIDLGNSGTALRLLAGLLAGMDGVEAVLTGDESLRSRPMGRIVEPLLLMGADIAYMEQEGKAPLRVRGKRLYGINYEMAVASAQVKSALMLAALGADGDTTIVERTPTRDHTERMLPLFGPRVCINESGGIRSISIQAAKLQAVEVNVPGDFSSAFLWVVLGALLPGEGMRIAGVGLNETRMGALRLLQDAGADINVHLAGYFGTEPLGSITALSSKLSTLHVAPSDVPLLVDEIPLLALAASQARGESVLEGLGELRHKESDRIAETVRVLTAFGAKVDADGDTLGIHGPQKLAPAEVDCRDDHRIALLALACALLAGGESTLHNFASADVSYPGVWEEAKTGLGVRCKG
jgi:3-phosphoshikimate 1-carboxyvinyltransferase